MSRSSILWGVLCVGLVLPGGCAQGSAVEPGPTEDIDAATSDAFVPPSDSGRPGDSASEADTSEPVKDASPPPDVAPPPDAGTCNNKLVVNELQSEGATASQEFIELFNPTTCDVSLDGWSLKYSSASGSSPVSFFTGTPTQKVVAGGFFVVACDEFTGVKNATYPSGKLAEAAGQVGVFNKADVLVDGLGYGSISVSNRTMTEGSPGPSPPVRQSLGRSSGADTNNNQADFRIITSPTPGAAN